MLGRFGGERYRSARLGEGGSPPTDDERADASGSFPPRLLLLVAPPDVAAVGVRLIFAKVDPLSRPRCPGGTSGVHCPDADALDDRARLDGWLCLARVAAKLFREEPGQGKLSRPSQRLVSKGNC